MVDVAKIFQHGRSQAVRLPKEFRFAGKEVRVRRVGNGVLLEPMLERKSFDAEAFWAKIDALTQGAEIPYVTDEGLRPELDDEPTFEA